MPRYFHRFGILACASLALIRGAPLVAQEFTRTKSAPITVEAVPVTVIVGGSTMLRGSTVARDTSLPVTLTVTWLHSNALGAAAAAAPAPTHLSAPYQSNGAFEVEFRTSREGRYHVEVTSPDGSGKATTELTVVAAGAMSQESADRAGQVLALSSELLEELHAMIDRQPVSPVQQELDARLPRLEKALAERKAAIESARRMLANYHMVTYELPDVGMAFLALQRGIDDWQLETDGLSDKLRVALNESRESNKPCEQLVVIEEGFKLLSTALNLSARLSMTFKNFAVDLDLALAANRAPPTCQDACQFKLVEAVKNRSAVETALLQAEGEAIDFADYASNLPGLLADLGAYTSHGLFDEYCERFEGPITATMYAEFVTARGTPWWKYRVRLEGIMTLVYRKGGDSEEGIAVAGHIAGTGTSFRVWDNALRALHGDVLAGALVEGHTIPPFGVPFSDFEGLVAMQVVPTFFFIPVDGRLVGRTLTLSLGAARRDFVPEYTQARGAYLIVGGFAGILPGFTTYTLPYKDAHFIIEKATHTPGGQFELPVEVGEHVMKSEKKFHATSGSAEARGTYDLDVKVCNPKC